MANNYYLFNYENRLNYTKFTEQANKHQANSMTILRRLAELNCQNEYLSLFCNAFYVPCDLTTGEPRGACVDSCRKVAKDCPLLFQSSIQALSSRFGANIPDYCEDTLTMIKLYIGTNFTNATGVESNCFSLQGLKFHMHNIIKTYLIVNC